LSEDHAPPATPADAPVGLTVLVTRPEPGAAETASRLRVLGFAPMLAPMLAIAKLPAHLPPPERLGGILLTSGNAVGAFPPGYHHLPVWTVGRATAARAREAGFATVTSADGDALALAALLGDATAVTRRVSAFTAKNPDTGTPDRLLKPRGSMPASASAPEPRESGPMPAGVPRPPRFAPMTGGAPEPRNSPPAPARVPKALQSVPPTGPLAGPLLLATAHGQGGALCAALRRQGFRVIRRVVYEARPASTLPPAATAALRRGGLVVLFFSGDTARTFVRLAQRDGLAASLSTSEAVAISGKVGVALERLPWRRIRVAVQPNQDAMLALLP
jgi:uroporphyrinogen-III synthase